MDNTGSGYRFRLMTGEEASRISGWHYEPPYDFYDARSDPDDLAELLDPKRRKDAYFSAFDEGGVLVGFFQFEREGSTVDVGLGMRPDLTGQGLGIGYLLAGLEFARERFEPERFTLSVATFNERAIQVYERAGFRRNTVYSHYTSGGEHLFLSMAREA
jgi:ribosomal-protein-alanine N-acetyltransferase